VGCGSDQTAKLGACDFERHMLETALRRQQQPLRREVFERGLRAAFDLIDGFDLIAALVKHAHRKFALEIPHVP
jgi:hypothetical protein